MVTVKFLLMTSILLKLTAAISYFPNMNIRNGVWQPSINNVKMCLDTCIRRNRQNCAGFDFNLSNLRCYFHTSATECGIPIKKKNCVHYRFIDCTATTMVTPSGPPTAPPTTAKPIGLPSLSSAAKFTDVHIKNGIFIKYARNLLNCFKVCYISPSCQAFDWDNGLCFVHKKSTACNVLVFKQGSNHYRISANCNPVPFNCFNVGFQTFSQSNRPAGRRIAINVNFIQCQDLCKSRTQCQAVDWNIAQKTCWEHTTTGRPLPSSCCNHARKLCNDGSTQSPIVTTTRATVPTALGPTTRPTRITTPAVQIQDNGKCPSELLAVPNTRSSAGMDVAGITDADACKAWCLTNVNCVAVDFDNLATSGVRCFYHDVTTFNTSSPNNDSCCTQYRKLPKCETKRCWVMPRQAVTTNVTIGTLTFYQPVDELFNLEPNMTSPGISLDPCTGLCKIETHFSRNTVTGDINPFSPVEAERSCYTGGNPLLNSHKNCQTVVSGMDSATNTQNVSYTCYCSSDQCNAFWSQVIQSCIAHYPLDCHTLDLTFAQRHGKGFNLKYSGTDQAKNWSGIFDGNSFVQVDTFMNTVLGMVGAGNNVRAEFTMLFWFKFTSKQVGNMTIISNGPHGKASLDVMTSYVNDTHRAITATVRINGNEFFGTVMAPYNQWQYFSIRILPIANYELYLDVGDTSQLTDSMKVMTNLPITGTGIRIDTTGNPLCIGKQYIPTTVPSFNIPGEFYIGSLDEVWMFGRGLADNELNSLVQSSYYPVRLNP